MAHGAWDFLEQGLSWSLPTVLYNEVGLLQTQAERVNGPGTKNRLMS